MSISINRLIAIFRDEHEPEIEFWDYDKHHALVPAWGAVRLYWTTDDGKIVDGADNTIVAICTRPATVEQIRPLAEQFFEANKPVIETIKWLQRRFNEQRRDFLRLQTHLLPRLLKHNDIPLTDSEMQHTVDGRLFPYLIFREGFGRNRNPNNWSGYICPECCAFEPKWLGEKVIASGRDYAMWLQDWTCEQCGATWQYKKVWSD